MAERSPFRITAPVVATPQMEQASPPVGQIFDRTLQTGETLDQSVKAMGVAGDGEPPLPFPPDQPVAHKPMKLNP